MTEYISQDYLDRAYKIVVSLNMEGKFANHERFCDRAVRMHFGWFSERWVRLSHLERAFRALPEKHPDVIRVSKDIYVIKRFEKLCERDICRERLRRIGCVGGVRIYV